MENSAGTIEATDVGPYNGMLAPWEVRLTQLSNGGFHGRLDFARIGETVIYRERWSRRMLVDGLSPAGYFMMGMPINLSGTTNWSGEDLDAGTVACASPSSELNFTTPEGADHLVILVPKSRVIDSLDHGTLARLPSAAFPRHSPADSVAAWSRLLQRQLGKSARGPDMSLDLGDVQCFEWQMLALARLLFGGIASDAESAAASRSWSVVIRARDFLDSRMGVSRVSDLVAAVGVSERTLEYAFRKTLGITPSCFLRRHRMNCAHRDLAASASDFPLTVTETALKWGFPELGRFAVEYRKLFGECPSETLSKSETVSQRLADACR